MRKLLLALCAAVALTPVAYSAQDARLPIDIASLEAVDSISALGRLHGWRPVDNDTLIIWSSRRNPYLVELMFPSVDLRFATAIGVSRFGGQIHARFDKVYVAGFDYPIAAIYKLSREEARAF
jgi:hypothetical protein